MSHSFHYTLFRSDLSATQVPNYANYHESSTQQYKNTDSLCEVFPYTHSFVCLCIFFLNKKIFSVFFKRRLAKGRKSKKESVVLNLNMIA